MLAAAKLSLPLWILVLFLSFLNYLLRFVRWEMYLQHLDTPVIPRFRHLLIYIAGFALTTTPGKAGEALRSIYLKPYGVEIGQSLSVLFVERLMDLLSIVFIALFAVSFFENSFYQSAAWISGAVVLAMMPLLHNQRLWNWLAGKARKRAGKLSELILKLIEMINASAKLLKNKLLYSGFLLAVVAWGVEGVGFYIVLQALGADVSIPLAIGIYSIAVLVGAISFMPGGLGSTEAVMGLLLIAVGTDKSSAVAATLICRMATLWFAVVLGVAALVAVSRNSIERYVSSAK